MKLEIAFIAILMPYCLCLGRWIKTQLIDDVNKFSCNFVNYWIIPSTIKVITGFNKSICEIDYSLIINPKYLKRPHWHNHEDNIFTVASNNHSGYSLENVSKNTKFVARSAAVVRKLSVQLRFIQVSAIFFNSWN